MSDRYKEMWEDAFHENLERKAEISELKAENARLKAETMFLKSEVERLKNNIAYLDQKLDEELDK